jgi:hypothetical protein
MFYDCKSRDRRNIWQEKEEELENFAKSGEEKRKNVWDIRWRGRG